MEAAFARDFSGDKIAKPRPICRSAPHVYYLDAAPTETARQSRAQLKPRRRLRIVAETHKTGIFTHTNALIYAVVNRHLRFLTHSTLVGPFAVARSDQTEIPLKGAHPRARWCGWTISRTDPPGLVRLARGRGSGFLHLKEANGLPLYRPYIYNESIILCFAMISVCPHLEKQASESNSSSEYSK